MPRVYKALQNERFLPKAAWFLVLNSMSVAVHRHGTVIKKHGNQCIGISPGGLATKIHVVSADEHVALFWSLSEGNLHDAPIGRQLLKSDCPKVVPLLTDKVYENAETRQFADQVADVVIRAAEIESPGKVRT